MSGWLFPCSPSTGKSEAPKKVAATVQARLSTAEGLERQVLAYAMANPPQTSNHVDEVYAGVRDERGAQVFATREQVNAAYNTTDKQTINARARSAAIAAGMPIRH